MTFHLFLTYSMLTVEQPGCRHLDSFSASWWTLSHSQRICGRSCPDSSPAWLKGEQTLQRIEHKYPQNAFWIPLFQSEYEPVELVSRGGEKFLYLWRTFPAQSAWRRQLAYTRSPDQLRWAANPDVTSGEKKKTNSIALIRIWYLLCIIKNNFLHVFK